MTELDIPIDNDEDIINQCGPVEIPLAPELVQALDESGPRLMISKIESENFKSYGGLRSMGPFHKNFTCIIGPNGSGKSNVIDSMLFVFGYRAAKVRSKKLSQLIHKSELIPNADSCMVAVHFQKIIDKGIGPTDYEVVPNSQFVVTRRAYKDNSSIYWVDNTRVVYRELANMLRQHGVDLDHNRFLILQGEVEQIALMKPKAPTEHEDGFLEYLEDIIGSSRFKQPLTIFADRIERLNDLRLEKLARVKAVEKEKDDLEGVRNEAMGYLRLVNQLTRMKNILYHQNLFQERRVEADTKERLTTAQTEIKSLVTELKEKSRELERTETERDTLVEKHTALLKQHRDAKAKFSEFEAEDSRLRDEHAHVKATGKRLTKALQTERLKLEELERLPSETDSRKQIILRQLAELESTKKKHELAYQETVDSLAKETAPLRLKVEAVEAELAPLQAQADELTSKLALERQQFDLVMANKRREQERADKARSAAQMASTKLNEREAELSEAKKRLGCDGGTSQRRQSSSSSVNLLVGLTTATRDLTEVRTKEAELTKELNEKRAKLAESKSTFQADSSRGRVYNALMEAQRSGQIPGILGRLGDLGAIPPRYDVAMSTACSALDHIVTDTMDTAQQAVHFLKQHNLGLATFIGLDKMSKWTDKCKQSFTVPRGDFKVERLFDLVQTVDDKVRPAFYFAIRDTLVTDSMDSAVKVAFNQRQRHRVVTLQGQLIETSGAMSGGGGRPLCGRILTNLTYVQERKQARGRGSISGVQDTASPDLATMERELASGDANLARMREERSRLEEFVTRLTRQKEETERTMKRCEVECTRLHAQVTALTTEADSAAERAKTMGPAANEQKRLESELNKLEQTVNKKTELADKKRATAESLKTELLDVGSARLTAVRSRLDAIEKKTKETNDQLTKLEVSVKTTARNCQKAQTRISNMEAELESTKEKLTEVDGKLKELEEEARVCMDAFKSVQSAVEELQSTKEITQTKLTELESQLNTIQKSEATARRVMSQLEADLAQASSKARQWQRELRALRLHRVDGESDDEEAGEDIVIEALTSSHPVLKPEDSSFRQPEDDTSITTAVSSQKIKPERPKSNDLPSYTQEQLDDLTVNIQEMRGLEERISSMAPNMAAIEEYRRKAETYLSRVSELNQVTDVLGAQRKHMEDAKSKRLSEFLTGFHAITAKLKEMYQMITQGGDAELELIDSLDPFSEGIVFSVRPPKKSWKNIANLSGGEKTLSSLALVFALHHYKPTPLYVMDEIDAALDFKNVSIVGNYLKERTKNAQFIVISLRNNMFELADRLCGIYKTRNITKTITLDCSQLTTELRQMVVRVATAHGREKELQISQTGGQSQPNCTQFRSQQPNPMVSQRRGSAELMGTQDAPIKIE